MFLSIATTTAPATDLGYLLMKHPDRVHETEFSFGKAVVFYPEARDERCEAVMTLDIDPVGLVRRGAPGAGIVDQYVNDRPYAASSFLSVALNRTFRSAMTGTSRERPDLAASTIRLDIRVTPVPARGGEALVAALFEPLGWTVELSRVAGPTGPSHYVTLRLQGDQKLADALSHLYVLLPVLDNDKHYWVGDDEVDKLVAKGGAWLAAHPARDLIARRYLKHRHSLARAALARLAPEEADEVVDEQVPRAAREETLEAPIRLHDLRLDTVVTALRDAGASSVADLGCGEGRLLVRLAKDSRFKRIIGMDVSVRALERAGEKLKLDLIGGASRERIQLLHGPLTYVDDRWKGVDAAVLVEVIEHLEPDRLPALAKVVFGAARPKTVIVTTPNADHNALFETLTAGELRHPDHRFEWTRAEFEQWVRDIGAAFGYAGVVCPIGAVHETYGAPTQMAVFTR